MQKVAIIQNQSASAPSLTRLCEEALTGFELVALADGVDAGISAVRLYRPDLVLVDVDLPDGCGFQVFEATQELSYGKAVFCPSNRFRVKAERFQAQLFLKSEENAQLVGKLAHFFAKRRGVPISDLYQQHFRKWDDSALQRVYLPGEAGHNGFLDALRIVRIFDNGDSRVVFDSSGHVFRTERRFKVFVKALKNNDFFRASQHDLLNLAYIEHIDMTQDTHQVRLLDGSHLSFERAILHALKKELDLFAARSNVD